MKNFGYCIWLVNNKSIWNYPNKGFRTHLTIKSNLTLDQAINIYNSIKKKPIILKINSDLLQSEEDNFYALYYNVKYINTDKPNWWPNNPHVSFKYKYNLEFSNDDKKFEIIHKECLFDDIIIMNCNNHYSEWYQIK